MKEEMVKQLNGSAGDFFSLLLNMRGTSPLNERLVQFLTDVHQGKTYSLAAQKVLHLFFSLSDDGNTRMSLNPERLLAKWQEKWDGLVVLASNGKNPSEIENVYPGVEDFRKIVEAGCKDLVDNVEPPLIIEFQKDENQVDIPYLYTEKYLFAKTIIEKCFRKGTPECVFDGNSSNSSRKNSYKEDIEAVIEDTSFDLKAAQDEAIVKGETRNLIITGGPGTGKTTVVFFLLWNLLKSNPEMMSWNIHFAAPSGKAANRLRESIGESIAMLKLEEKEDPVVKHLKNIDSYTTLHRLLSYNPQTNGFRYCEKTRFPDKSIFVIDEASMIDLSLFASFMQALPENKDGYRLFILGDRDQLPSVEAGAVLGEILGLDKSSVVELTESNRFDNKSKVGRLSRFIQKKLEMKDLEFDLKWIPWQKDMPLWDADKLDEVNLLQLGDDPKSLRKSDEEELLQSLLKSWTNRFYCQKQNGLLALAQKVRPELTEKNYAEQGLTRADWKAECDAREDLWELSDAARILSAERRGLRGVENINIAVAKALGYKDGVAFDGKLMILTKNQSYFDLYNGDSGIVVNCRNNPMLMLKRKGDFVFYPLSMLPSDAIETAFAITIHKSQGSGYPNIMMFLPTRKGHPLLNRQILYTGITRTKKQSLTIVATEETFKAACETVIRRDTGIEL